MKKTYSTIILLLGIGLGGFLFAQQSINPINEDQRQGKKQPEVKIHVQKEADKEGNVTRMDSTWIWTWTWENEFPEDFQGQIEDFFKRFGDKFTFHFNDSILSGQRFHELLNEDFSSKLEGLERLDEKFNEDFLEKLNEKLEMWQERDFQFQWNEKFNQHLQQEMEQMLEKWHEFYQDHQEFGQPQKKAL